MGFGKIRDMDEVAHAGAIPRRIVVAEQLHRARAADRSQQGVGDEVGELRVVLADIAIDVGAGGVEIAERPEAQAVRAREILEHLFAHQLGVAIDADRVLRQVLGKRQALGIAVDGAGRGEDKVGDALGDDGAQEVEHAADIVVVEGAGIALALAHFDAGGEVHHGVGLVLSDGGAQRLGVADVALDQGAPAHGVVLAGAHVVENDGLAAGHVQRLGRMGADIAGPAANQNALNSHG